jgi:3'(2'), 5'-bisphosphate nucleotidase
VPTARPDRYWTLDPIDGTKGFLRGDQYAIALALVEHGEVVLGVLGCPNLPNPDGSRGAIFAAGDGTSRAGTARPPSR